MKHNTVLIVLSLLKALFFGVHCTGDIVFGIENGEREILVGAVIVAVYLYSAVALRERLAGYIIRVFPRSLHGSASAGKTSPRTRSRSVISTATATSIWWWAKSDRRRLRYSTMELGAASRR